MKLSATTRAVIAASVVGGAATLLIAVAWQHGRLTMTRQQWIEALVIGLLALGSWVRPFVLYRDRESSAFQMDEGFFLMMALLLPPVGTLGTLGATTVLAQIIRGRPLAKSVFNVGQVQISAGLALAASRAIAVPGRPLSGGAVLAALLGVWVYFAVNTALVSLVVVSMGASWREAVFKDLRIQMTLAVAGFLVGGILALAVEAHVWALALVVPALIVQRRLVTARFKAQQDRARMEGLLNVTLGANRGLREESVIDTVLAAARELMRCTEARLTTEAPGPDEFAAPIDVAGSRQWLVVSGRSRAEPFDTADRILLDAIVAIGKGAFTNAQLYRQVGFERGRLASITLNIGEGVCAVDASGKLTFVNPAAAAMVHLPSLSVAIGDSVSDEALLAPDFLLGPARDAMATGRVIRADDALFETPDGEAVPVAYTASAVRQNGEAIGAVIAFRDITETKKFQLEMTHRASHDSLTGLYNRRKLVERLEEALERSLHDGKVHGLIFVDVDRFKSINDSLGHGTGDDLLKAIAARMNETVASVGLLARVGGDEFVVLIEDLGDVDDAARLAGEICAAVERPLVLSDGYEIVASVSIGIATTERGKTADDILRDADVAMYKAKGRGGTYQVFDKAIMGTRSSERIYLESALRKGIERNELEVHYQPIVSVEGDHRIVGAEALVRWRHPTEGLIEPARFIPMAEETGLILPLGKHVLEQACLQVRSVRDRLGVDLPISVNLSPRQFQQSGLFIQVLTALEQAGVPSNLLTFEITETMVMDDLAGARDVMRKLNRVGVHLAIDDFGTGHSSLAYLKQFPVHEVKVDRAFVSGVATDPVDTAIIRAVVDLADAMGIEAVAEGVETKEQVAGLRMLGCHRAQGFYFARPLTVSEFDALVDNHFSVVPADAPPELRVVQVGRAQVHG